METALRIEDIEGYIKIHGAPDDEYDSEAKEIAEVLAVFSKDELTEAYIVSVIMPIWARYFNLDDRDMELRLPYIRLLRAGFYRINTLT